MSTALRPSAAAIAQYLSSHQRALTLDERRRVVLLRAVPEWNGAAELDFGDGRRARVAAAPSPLAVHELILDHLARDGEPRVLVLLTDREQPELDPAILARGAFRQRILAVDTLDVVKQAFGAEQVDPRLRADAWAIEALLDAAPPGGWPRLGGGMLSRATALTLLAQRRLGLDPGDGLDINTLLRWTMDPGGPARLLSLRQPERAGLVAFLGADDRAARALFALVTAGHGPDAVAFGLVGAALWTHAEPDEATYRARGRAERWLGEEPPAQGEALDALIVAFGEACEQFVRTLLATSRAGTDEERARQARRTVGAVLDRAASLARQFGAERAVAASPVLGAGLEARFAAAGRTLVAGTPGEIAEAVRALEEHQFAADRDVRIRIERVRMAQRLARWLAGNPSTEAGTVAAGIERHIAETGWVDQALEHLEAGGDPEPELRRAYDALASRVRERRRALDESFARQLAAGTDPGGMPTVESFLSRVVKPLIVARTGRRLLLLVLDGMSAAIATELGEELRGHWAEYDPLPAEGMPRRRAMAAALPTVTAVSRTSLLAGRLMKGTDADEKRLFPAHPCWRGAPAAVFHKGGVRSESAGAVFGPELADALADERTHVAVVLNTIDDRLAKEQKRGDGTWRVDEIGGLRELLRVAAEQGMAVILVSDHGHVVDRHGVKVAGEGIESARHRLPGGPLAATEVRLSGPRVVWPEPGAEIVALWDADSRYTAQKAGYHGGAALAEVCVPILALLPFGAEPPKGWRELGDQRPPWWIRDQAAALPAPDKPSRPSKPAKRGQARADRGEALFDVVLTPGEDALLTPGLRTAGDALVDALLASPIFQAQLEAMARKPAMAKVEQAIRVLLDAGTLPVTALAQRVGESVTRADGFAAVLRQVLNYDGVQVLETLPDGRTLRLNTTLLREQFELGH
ncbi:BREX-2 system phosphatase PglZ [Thermoactinospora rubra]|uniref:BREX-2 system phosphatase PglZ n=1 Tax=Thermoactinospora rubra TaxID=1088767 RepID=UPI000A10719C|nr:BREX-2 system phosphatase PglZ [Thermoactinospora rubra]